MKKIFILSSLTFLLFSCTDVVDIPLDTSSPKLVVEAGIYWKKGTNGTTQKVKLTTTTNFYTNTVPVVSGATVQISNSSNTIFNFNENPGTGEYICTDFIPIINETYTLTVTTGGKTYTATETLKEVAPIKDVIQEQNSGFDGELIQLTTKYDDPLGVENFYAFEYQYPEQKKPDIYVTDDVFFDGNEFYSLLFETNNDRKIKVGDKIIITHTGISKQYYEYLNILLNLAGNTGGGPFQAPPVSVRGNLTNTTDQKDFPFGYFNLSETDSVEYTVQ